MWNRKKEQAAKVDNAEAFYLCHLPNGKVVLY